MPEVLNERALSVINRVSKKLTGRDFAAGSVGAADGAARCGQRRAPAARQLTRCCCLRSGEVLDVAEQVQRLIAAATSTENLCQCYVGWCPWW